MHPLYTHLYLHLYLHFYLFTHHPITPPKVTHQLTNSLTHSLTHLPKVCPLLGLTWSRVSCNLRKSTGHSVNGRLSASSR